MSQWDQFLQEIRRTLEMVEAVIGARCVIYAGLPTDESNNIEVVVGASPYNSKDVVLEWHPLTLDTAQSHIAAASVRATGVRIPSLAAFIRWLDGERVIEELQEEALEGFEERNPHYHTYLVTR